MIKTEKLTTAILLSSTICISIYGNTDEGNFLKKETSAFHGRRISGAKARDFLPAQGEPSNFGHVTAYVNQRYKNRWIGRRGPMLSPPRSPDLTRLISFRRV
jgi:hypothetical protein